MAQLPKPFLDFSRAHPDVVGAYEALGRACAEAGPLDEIEHPRVCYSLNPTALEPLREFLVSVVSPGQSRSTGRG